MSNIFWKHFHHFFSRPKCLPSITPSPPSPSKQDQTNNPSSTTTTSTSSPLLIKNFNSLYDLSSDFSTSKSITPSIDDYFSSDNDTDAVSPPDFTTIFASQRFFFSSPGRSNSIIDTKLETQETTPLNGGVAVKKYSSDPYQDFRCSMQEMIEARNVTDVMATWDFLHDELLPCYLTLNPKHTHKFIIRAFADILISLLSSQDSASHRKFEGHRRSFCK